MKTLHLLRHAKSSWDDPSLADYDRPLTPRGERGARRMAAHIKRQRIRVDLVLCSSARRTRQTLELVAPSLTKAEVSIEDSVYTGDATRLMARLRRVDESVKTALVVGHNPALQDLALDLAGDGEVAALGGLHQKLPTGALVTLTTGSSWGTLERGVGYLETLVVPRELPD